MEFGTSVGARVLAEDLNSVMMWRLSKITDINGNYIEFKYDNTDRDNRIQQIIYTGNLNAGLIPYNKINFSYSIRTDQNTIYEAGASLTSKYLLDKITVVHTNDANIDETVKTYKLNYGFDNSYSMLKEVVEFGGDENSPSLNSTIFLYGEPSENLYSESVALFNGECIAGDFNADGKTDILASTYYYNNLIKYSSGYKILLDPNSTTPLYEKTFDPGHIIIESKKLTSFFAADYNRDGRDDVVNVKTLFVTYPSGNTHWVADRFNIEFTTSTGSTTQQMPMPPGDKIIHPSGNFFIQGDFDGDGNQDYITIFTTHIPSGGLGFYHAYICTPGTIFANYGINQFSVTPGEWSANSIASADKILPFDLNGDGKQELLVVKGSQTSILSINPETAITYLASIILTTTDIVVGDRIFPGDFNGDKKNDLLIRKANGQWKILYSTGTGFTSTLFSFNQTVAMNGNYWDDKIVIGDFDGDGKSDIAHGFAATGGSKFSLYYSRGFNSSTFFYEQHTYNNILPYIDLVTGDFNGDGRTDILSKGSYYGAPDIIYFKRENTTQRLLRKITTGHNVTTTFTYWPLTSSYVYQRTVPLSDPVNQNPFNYIQLPMYVVSAISNPDGAGGIDVTQYNYENAVIHRAAKGFLGFKKITAENYTSGVTRITELEINTQFAVPYTTRQLAYLTSTNELLSESLVTNSFHNLSTGSHDIRYLQKIDKTVAIDYLNDDRASESVNTYDSYGNITGKTTKIGIVSGNTVTPTETTITSSAFSIHNTPVPAKPDYITITKTRVGMPAISATTTYTYTTNGLIASETGFSGLPKAVTATYTYNNLGNPLTVVTSSTGLNSRTATSTYDNKGRFILSIQKSGTGVSQTVFYTVSTKWGVPLTQTSTDCLVSTNEYDDFGTLMHTILPDGNNVYKSNTWQTTDIFGAFNPNKLFYVYTHFDGGSPDSKVYINKFGQQWRNETVSMYGPTARWHTISTTYDNKGNVKTKTNPHFPNIPANPPPPPAFQQPIETPRITTYNYDAYNRTITVVNDIGTVSYSYNQAGNGKMQTTITNQAGQSSSQITDATGKIISSIDNGGQLDFTFDSWGNQLEVKRGGTTIVYSGYDQYGKQTSLNDINAGTTVYNYDAYGQLKQQTDALGNTYNMNYDDLGRIITRVGPEGTTSYEYYNHVLSGCSNNNLTKVSGFNGVINEYTYDGLRRLWTETKIIDGTSYTTSYQYNNFSQVSKTTYPSGLAVYRNYDVNGYLNKVYHSTTHPKNSLFQNGWVDGEGKYLTYGLGFGQTTSNTYFKGFPATTITSGIQNLAYNFDLQTGNLLQRTDNLKNQTEYFGYDNLNRLTTSTPNNTQQSGITYDANGSISMGNIVAKTDAGYYKYKNDKINAVAYVMNTPVPGQQPVTPAPNTQISLLEQQITYTPFLKTATIGEGQLYGGPYIEYTYGPEYERVKSELWQGHLGLTETKYYLGNYEKQIKNGVTREIHYVGGGNGLCAILVNESGVLSSYIVYTDHLGSISTVTDNNGANIIAEQNFDAWGRNRNPSNWNVYDPYPNLPDWLYRGYTGHEMMPLFSLVNMNGRMYDPLLGRMLSSDSYVQNPLFTQNYNRYSYCWNNPLKYTDPSGNFLKAAFFAVAFLGEFISNLTSGTSDALGKAFNGAKSATDEFDGAFRWTLYDKGDTRYTAGINPFSLSISADGYFREGDWTFNAGAGISAIGGVGITVGAAYSAGNFSFNVSGGVSPNATGNGSNPRIGGGVTYFDRANNQSFSVGLTAFGGKDAQKNWFIGYSKGDFSFRMTNDASVGGDKFRTAAAEIGIGETSFGFNLYTTAPPDGEHSEGIGLSTANFKSMWGPNSHGTYSSGSRVYAGLYFGYQSNNTVSRIGVDAPWVQDFFQNGIHRHFTHGPYFNTNNGPSTRLFLQTLNYFPYTLY
ncbi:MAG: VCBS repeat-containing protein [Chitinophagaceae bacterium]|nr:VCBS repeat-containing protein [Chitinophagaceae bacterium]